MKQALVLLVVGSLLVSLAWAQEDAQKVLTLVSAQVKPVKPNGKSWDTGFGKMKKPDIFVKIYFPEKDKWVLKYTSEVMKNTCKPTWNTRVPLMLAPGMIIKVDVFDKDLRDHDLIASKVITIPDNDQEQIVIENLGALEKLVFIWKVPTKQASADKK